jgi:hypothetical protein
MPDGEESTFLAGDEGDAEGDGAQVEEVIIDAEVDPTIIARAIETARQIALVGLGVGLICIISGVVLLVLGVSGAVTWTVSGLGASSELQTSATGVVIAVVGLAVIYITRLNVRVEHAVRSGQKDDRKGK